MKNYSSVEQRITAAYIDRLPETVSPDGTGSGPRYIMHSFVKDFFNLVFNDPPLLFKSLNGDDAFNNRFNKSSDRKPELLKNMKKAVRETEMFFDFLLDLSPFLKKGKLPPGYRIKDRYLKILELLGIGMEINDSAVKVTSDKYNGFAGALLWMAEEKEKRQWDNAAALFNNDNFSMSQNYRRLCGDAEQYDRLADYLEKAEYHVMQGGGSSSLEFLKGKNGGVPEKGGFQYKVNHIGISMNYDPFVKEPASYSVCIPNMAKLLSFYNEMDEILRKFIVTVTKKCDNCRYCVQTDKTGKREKAYAVTALEGRKYALCTYFPGYYYTFTELNELIVGCMIKILSFMDERLDFLVK